jgi:hypothetical protein
MKNQRSEYKSDLVYFGILDCAMFEHSSKRNPEILHIGAPG